MLDPDRQKKEGGSATLLVTDLNFAEVHEVEYEDELLHAGVPQDD